MFRAFFMQKWAQAGRPWIVLTFLYAEILVRPQGRYLGCFWWLRLDAKGDKTLCNRKSLRTLRFVDLFRFVDDTPHQT